MAELSEKAERYGRMLSDAVESVKVVEDTDEADEFHELARSYLEDGRHFLDEDDEVNALAAFSYGHAWLDAGVRVGFFEMEEGKEDLFAV